jgi:very-short-patch-repair endonuclease
MGGPSGTVEEIMARLAWRAHGVVTRGELLREGVTRRQIERRVEKGLLIVEFPGVYRVGHRAPSREARYLAAVKACGDGAALSGRAAAHLYGLIQGHPPPPEVIARTKREIKGIITHRRSAGVQVGLWLGIPVIAVAHTLVDLAAVLTAYMLARACHEADVKYGIRPHQVHVVLRPNAKGARDLKRVLTGEEKVMLSRLERRFLMLLRRHGMPLPETNRKEGSKRVDCRWPEHRLTVELDSYTYHRTKHAWEQDRRREREAYARGDEFRRYTESDVYNNPEPVLRELTALLTARPGAEARRA